MLSVDVRPRSARGRTFSDLGMLRQFKLILYIDAEVPDRVLDLGVSE